jgi:hypothetical protein
LTCLVISDEVRHQISIDTLEDHAAQASKILYALDALDRRKPQEKEGAARVPMISEMPSAEHDDC